MKHGEHEIKKTSSCLFFHSPNLLLSYPLYIKFGCRGHKENKLFCLRIRLADRGVRATVLGISLFLQMTRLICQTLKYPYKTVTGNW